MGCYAVPLAAGLIHSVMRKKNGWTDKHHRVLNWLLWGGAVFGVVDHAWNRELFAFSYQDLFLGVMITVSIFLVAGGFLLADKWKDSWNMKA